MRSATSLKPRQQPARDGGRTDTHDLGRQSLQRDVYLKRGQPVVEQGRLRADLPAGRAGGLRQ